jgi:hypothetical protein
MEDPQLNCWFYFFVGRLLMTSKMFLQFWKEMKIQRSQVDIVWWVKQGSENKAWNSAGVLTLV